MKWEDTAALLDSADSIIVFTGAGISTNSGIPDFRGEGGLYETVKERYNLPSGEAIFDINYFDRDPEPFFDLSRELITGGAEPTRCHRMLGRMEELGKVRAVITQNIDRLHQRGGTKNILECHGTYDRGHCRLCKKEYPLSRYSDSLEQGSVPYCSCGGVIKPDVVFFGESLPDEFYALWEKPPRADLLLILGTSLQVRPAADLAMKLASGMKTLIVNREATQCDSMIDYVIHEDLDDFALAMEKLLNLD